MLDHLGQAPRTLQVDGGRRMTPRAALRRRLGWDASDQRSPARARCSPVPLSAHRPSQAIPPSLGSRRRVRTTPSRASQPEVRRPPTDRPIASAAPGFSNRKWREGKPVRTARPSPARQAAPVRDDAVSSQERPQTGTPLSEGRLTCGSCAAICPTRQLAHPERWPGQSRQRSAQACDHLVGAQPDDDRAVQQTTQHARQPRPDPGQGCRFYNAITA